MIKLEEGKFYRNRRDEKVGPMINDEDYLEPGFTSEEGYSYCPDGVCPGVLEQDLIAEWVDEKPQDSSEPPMMVDERIYAVTLRDDFARAALQSIGTWLPPHQAKAGHFDLNSDEAIKARAEWAYRQADAMLKARHVAKS